MIETLLTLNFLRLQSFSLANDKDTKVEAILDYIVERKRLDDLSKSIIDGRYNEQKVEKGSSWSRLFIACLFTIVPFETMWNYKFNLSGGKFEEHQQSRHIDTSRTQSSSRQYAGEVLRSHPIRAPGEFLTLDLFFKVAEDFFVREVSNPVEMANYLVTMTKHLISHFKVKIICIALCSSQASINRIKHCTF